jgi:hypothetical protein
MNICRCCGSGKRPLCGWAHQALPKRCTRAPDQSDIRRSYRYGIQCCADLRSLPAVDGVLDELVESNSALRLHAVQDILGRSSLRVTSRYWAVENVDKEDAVNRLPRPGASDVANGVGLGLVRSDAR